MNFVMLNSVGQKVQITMRGREVTDWRGVLEEAGKFFGAVKEKGWRPDAPTQAPPPAMPRAAEVAAEAGNAPLAAQLAQAPEVPPPPAGKQWATIDATRVLIIPQPDSRVKIEFYSAGHKFPDLKTTWKAEQVAALLKHVTAHNVTTPGDLAVNCRVWYTLGKEYEPGKHYKDIAHARPL